MGDATCIIDGCTRHIKVKSRGWCGTHHARWCRHGSTDDPRPTVDQRFWSKVDAEGDCWVWLGATNKGHGVFRDEGGKNEYAHRWAYQTLIGPIPAGRELDHLCRNRPCVNPDHLEVVPGAVNTQRGFRSKKTRCPRGHLYRGRNLYEAPTGGRRCRTCAHKRLADIPSIRALRSPSLRRRVERIPCSPYARRDRIQ